MHMIERAAQMSKKGYTVPWKYPYGTVQGQLHKEAVPDVSKMSMKDNPGHFCSTLNPVPSPGIGHCTWAQDRWQNSARKLPLSTASLDLATHLIGM